MLRIGEASKKYDISNRTLRYWEEMGVFKSKRAENDYRFYDAENEMRINWIALLRKLRVPITDIEKLFVAWERGTAINVLTDHLDKLRRDTAVYGSLIVIMEKLIRHLKDSSSLDQVLSQIEIQTITASNDLTHKETLQFKLSERILFMQTEKLNNVRIVKLPAMTVASYRAESKTPEADCSKVFNKFVLDNSLHKRDGYRFFGFNNPSPTEGNPVYGYEMWVTIPDDFAVLEPLIKKQFNGGLYASISTQMNEIGERWRMLNEWCKSNGEYDCDFSFQWLEECTMDFEMFISDEVADGAKQLDLLEPVKIVKL
jgi:DNA-binding transcriptional MerR regulator/DNA gyrase inhibitor GyrI